MPGRGQHTHAGRDVLTVVDELQPIAQWCLDRRRVGTDQLAGAGPVVPLGGAHQVTCVGERGSRDDLSGLGVRRGGDVARPSDVVVVQMGEQDGVDLLGGDAFGGKVVEQPSTFEGGQVGDGEVDTAEAEIHHDSAVGGADQEAADADGQLATAVEEFGVRVPPVGLTGRKQDLRIERRAAVGEECMVVSPTLMSAFITTAENAK